MINLFDITPKEFHPYVLDWFITGSRVICNPSPTNTDLDICVLVKKNKHVDPTYYLVAEIPFLPIRNTTDTWELSSDNRYPDDKFISLRKGEYNLIVMHDKQLFKRWRLATKVCKIINPLYKSYRVQIFESITHPPEEMIKVENLLE